MSGHEKSTLEKKKNVLASLEIIALQEVLAVWQWAQDQ
jgi:hypothetical protein